MTTSQGVLVRSALVKEKHVGADLALYVEGRRAIHVPNETARFIWECLADPLTVDELFFMLTEVFDEDPDRLRADLDDTLRLFTANGLVTAGHVTDADDPP